MKLTKQKLKRIITEEVKKALKEGPFDDMDAALDKEKKAPKVKCPANPQEAKSMAIAALKAVKGVKDQFKVMDILVGYCVSETKPRKLKGREEEVKPATEVMFKNKARTIVLDSELDSEYQTNSKG